MGNQHKNKSFNIQDASKSNLLGEKLAKARKDQKIRQATLIKKLEDYGINMNTSSYSCWERGIRTPNAYQLLALCQALGIDDVMGYFLDGTIRESGMNLLNDEGQALVKQYMHLLNKSGEYSRLMESELGESENAENIVEFDLYLQAASAGTGQFLDNDVHDRISLPRTIVPSGTEFALRISGDSMEPAFYSNQLAFVKRTVSLNPGEIGIFLLDGESYIKKYEEEMPEADEIEDYMYSSGNVQKKPVLVSLNNKYDPIHVTQNNKFSIIGKVLNRTGYDFI